MVDNLEAQGMKLPNYPMPVAPTFMERLCQLLRQRVNFFLNCEGATAPLTGTLHAVGQDYIELTTGTTAQTQVTLVPLWNICSITAAGAMNDVCPPPTNPWPTQPPGCGGPGPGPMPGCPMPGSGMGGGMGGCMPGMMPGMPGFMDIKKEEEEEK